MTALVLCTAALGGLVIASTALLVAGQRGIHRRLFKMNQAETQAFADLNTKCDALIAASEQSLTALQSVKDQLATAGSDPADVVTAIASVNAKIDAETARITSNLAAATGTAPAAPATPPADPSAAPPVAG